MSRKYEYMECWGSEGSTVTLMDKVNEAGAEGWRLVGYSTLDNGTASALMERESTTTLETT